MIGVVDCAALTGFSAKKVSVEVDISRGLPLFCMVGLADNCVKEARVRVQSAILNSGFEFPKARISVNLAPADLRKDGTAFDLSIALALLSASGVIPEHKLRNMAAISELSLTGELKPVRGMLALAESMKEQGYKTLVVAKENAQEANLIKDIEVKVCDKLSTLVASILNDKLQELSFSEPVLCLEQEELNIDMKDVCGQEEARRALLIAAAGDHNMLFMGGPGSGKSMMAHRIPTILPPLSYEESMQVTRIYSLAGLTIAGKLVKSRPFRAPHHSISKAGLVGGGSSFIRPGEVSLASFGVLFLDELLEFPRTVLEVLRQPLEAGQVTISRSHSNVTYPAHISLVAALNPCPCGNYGQPKKVCSCSSLAIQRYQSRLSGPLLDRIDLHIDVPPVDIKLMASSYEGESSREMQQRVIKSRLIQSKRLGANKTNGKMSRKEVKLYAALSSEAQSFLVDAAEKISLSARSFDRVIRVGRTIADLVESKFVQKNHIMEALQYRGLKK